MPKKKKKRTHAAGRLATPLDYENAWGSVTDDVPGAFDMTSLMDALDEMTKPRLWAAGLTMQATRAALPLRVHGGEKSALLAVVRGEAATTTSTTCHPQFVLSSKIDLRDTPGRGRGWFASSPLAAGTVVLVERPLVGILDCEWQGEEWSGCCSSDSAAVSAELARCWTPSVAALMAPMHPRVGAEVPQLSEGEDDSEDEAELMARVVASAWARVDIPQTEKDRLAAVVRMNSLGFYTASEQLCHHGNFSALTGSGLFALSCCFNHSCDPTCARFSVGDISFFVTNRPVQSGEELCISYVESELLSAPTTLRAQSLNRDFECACVKCVASTEEETDETKEFAQVDSQLQAALASLPPVERLEEVERALRGEVENEDGSVSKVRVLGKDAQELRVVQALALMQLQRHSDALLVWRRLAAFVCRHCPPFDEALTAFALQASLCALCDGRDGEPYLTLAVEAHRVAFGPGLLRRRYQREVMDALVPDTVKAQLWAEVDSIPEKVALWDEHIAGWSFTEAEYPPA